MSDPIISIIVPVYNTPRKLLEECLESLHLQEYEDAEFIIVDDGSDAEWIITVVEQFKSLDCRFKYLKKANSGPADSRNIGLKQSKGTYIMFVDSDDQLLPGACGYAVNAIESSHSDVVLLAKQHQHTEKSAFRKILNKEEKEGLMFSVLAFTSVYEKYGVVVDSPWAKIFKSSIIKEHNIKFPTNLSRSEDAFFCLYYYEQATTIYVDNYPVYKYIENPDSICRRMSDVSVVMLPEILIAEEEFIERKKEYRQIFSKALEKRTKKGIYESFSSYFFHADNKKSKWELSKELKAFLEQPLIKKYFSNFKMNNFNGEKNRICFWLIKRKMYYFFMLFNDRFKCRFLKH